MKIIDKARFAVTSASFVVLLTASLGMAQAQEFNLEALIEAARAEPQLTVFDSTGKIVEMAEAFAAKYGVDAVGTKMKAPAQI